MRRTTNLHPSENHAFRSDVNAQIQFDYHYYREFPVLYILM